jgi:hypothetical protein
MRDKKVHILSILKKVGGGALNVASLLMESGYMAQRYAMRRALGDTRVYKSRNKKSYKQYEEERQKRNYYQCIYELQRDGLIVKSHKDKKTFIHITQGGEKELAEYLVQMKHGQQKRLYEKKRSKNFIIVIFDIPERFRKKRNWLRAVLIELGFHIIQKSVWMGNTVIPQDFIDDLYEEKILPYVNFFETQKIINAKTAEKN